MTFTSKCPDEVYLRYKLSLPDEDFAKLFTPERDIVGWVTFETDCDFFRENSFEGYVQIRLDHGYYEFWFVKPFVRDLVLRDEHIDVIKQGYIPFFNKFTYFLKEPNV